MTYIMVDVEADGPIPGDYSMIALGAIVVEPALDRTFVGRLRPISEKWLPDALAVSAHSREATLTFDAPKQVMSDSPCGSPASRRTVRFSCPTTTASTGPS